jgi:outer membrane lipoprotein LolB
MWSVASPSERARARRRAAAGLLVLLMLGGCVTTQEQMAKKTTWNARRDALLALSDWQLEGRIALSAGADGWSGTFTWQQADEDLDFRFRGPLGLGGFRIHGDRERLRVKTMSGDQFYLTDPEVELRERFGWSIPVHSMRYWMLGVPAPGGETAETFNDQQQLALLEQLGWVVQYDVYGGTARTPLPRKLTMQGEGIRIRVVVERWEIDD